MATIIIHNLFPSLKTGIIQIPVGIINRKTMIRIKIMSMSIVRMTTMITVAAVSLNISSFLVALSLI